jgi:hypothetical protein
VCRWFNSALGHHFLFVSYVSVRTFRLVGQFSDWPLAFLGGGVAISGFGIGIFRGRYRPLWVLFCIGIFGQPVYQCPQCRLSGWRNPRAIVAQVMAAPAESAIARFDSFCQRFWRWRFARRPRRRRCSNAKTLPETVDNKCIFRSFSKRRGI